MSKLAPPPKPAAWVYLVYWVILAGTIVLCCMVVIAFVN